MTLSLLLSQKFFNVNLNVDLFTSVASNQNSYLMTTNKFHIHFTLLFFFSSPRSTSKHILQIWYHIPPTFHMQSPTLINLYPTLYPLPYPLPPPSTLYPHPLPLPSTPTLYPHPLPLPSTPTLYPYPLPPPSTLPSTPTLYPHPLPLPSTPTLYPYPLPPPSTLPSTPTLYPHPLPLPSTPTLYPYPLPPPSTLPSTTTLYPTLYPHPLPYPLPPPSIHKKHLNFSHRYRKLNLFMAETEYFNIPQTVDFSYFDTPFGRFGAIVCFDILFEDPTMGLIHRYNVDNILFPTAWMNVLPYFSANGFHQSFAYGMGVNVLAANLHIPNGRFLGSGIYSPGRQLGYINKPK